MFFQSSDLYAYAFEAGSLYVQADKPLGTKPAKLKVHLPEKEKCHLQVVAAETLEPCLLSWHRIKGLYGKTRPYTYRVVVPENVAQSLGVLLDPLPRQDERRSEARVKSNMKATSSALPGFSAVVLDISFSGVCLVLNEPISVDKDLQLHLELDSDTHAKLDLRSRVCWVRPVEQRYRAGVTFLDRLNYYQYNALSDYLQWARRIEAGQFGANVIRG